jgi:hypothetical protein
MRAFPAGIAEPSAALGSGLSTIDGVLIYRT